MRFYVLVSVVCAVVLVLLTITEIHSYLKPSTSSQISIQSSHDTDTFHINVDVLLPRMPCDVVGLDLQDSMGNHVSDYYGELHKHRLRADGTELSVETWGEKNVNRKEIADRVEKALDEGQGCNIKGFVEAVRVPGNFHIGNSAFGDIVQFLSMKGHTFDNSFRINHLSFGKKTDFETIAANFPDAGVMHPLDGFERELPSDEKAMRVGFYLKAVPAIFLGEFGTWINNILGSKLLHKNEVFQLTATSETEF